MKEDKTEKKQNKPVLSRQMVKNIKKGRENKITSNQIIAK
jgi:hypothetical protein